MKRLALPLLALVIATGIVYGAPVVNTWETDAKVVWNDTLGQAATETTFTDSVSVFGARGVYLLVRSSGSDSLTIPVLQVKLPNGAWTYACGAPFIPPSGGVSTTPFTTTTAVTGLTRMVIAHYNEASASGTPVPFSNDKFRWRVRATNARGNSATQKVSSGTITYQAVVLR